MKLEMLNNLIYIPHIIHVCVYIHTTVSSMVLFGIYIYIYMFALNALQIG